MSKLGVPVLATQAAFAPSGESLARFPRAAAIAMALPLLSIAALVGCGPTDGGGTLLIPGGTGTTQSASVGPTASVEIFSPGADLSITGGTTVETIFSAIGTTTLATVEVFFEPITDANPTPIANDGNELFVEIGLGLEVSQVTLPTNLLPAGSYAIGVQIVEFGEIVASEFAPGLITVNQAPQLRFTEPSANLFFDRSNRVNPTIDVAWEPAPGQSVIDPDSDLAVVVTLQREGAGTDELVVLRTSESQTGDSFSFELRTALFPAGRYLITAIVSDGTTANAISANATITLRGRKSGFVDLRELDNPAQLSLGGAEPVRGAIFEGFNPTDNAGSFVDGLGDVDDDGFDDLIVLAQFAKPFLEFDQNRNGTGEAYVIYGRQDRFIGRNDLNSTGTLFRGDVFTGVASQPAGVAIRPSRGISAFTQIDDMDGDGVDELVFGQPFVDSQQLSDRIVFSSQVEAPGFFRTGGVILASSRALGSNLTTPFPGGQVIDLAAIGTADYQPFARPLERFFATFYGPKAVSPVPTFFNRHFLTAAESIPSNIGDARTFRGGQYLGARFSTNEVGDSFGESLDRYDFGSLIIASPDRNPNFATRAGTLNLDVENNLPPQLPGSAVDAEGGGVVSILNWEFELDGTVEEPYDPNNDRVALPAGGPYHYIVDDFRWYPVVSNRAVALAIPRGIQGTFCQTVPGLTDPEGVDLVCRGTPGYIYDTDESDNEPVEPTDEIEFDPTLPLFTKTTRFYSATPGARLSNVSSVGDFNSDGLGDIAVGAPFINDQRGAVFLLFGRLTDLMRDAEQQVEELALPARTSGANDQRIFDGVRIIGAAGDRLGQAQDSAGDFNGDGVNDVLIGSPLQAERRGGAAIFFGNDSVINLTQADIPFEELDDRGLGVIFLGEDFGDEAGILVRGLGDVDGDGLTDIAIAAPNRSIQLDIDDDGVLDIDRTNCGVVYVIYGSQGLSGTISLADVGTERLPGLVFIGQDSGDFLGAAIGEQGDRSVGVGRAGDVDGDGRVDLILSSPVATPDSRVEAGEIYLIYGT